MQNFAGTIAVDSVGIALAAFGLLNPLFAAFIHVSSELAFILKLDSYARAARSAQMMPQGFLRPSPSEEAPRR